MGDTVVAHAPGVLVLGPAKNVAQALGPHAAATHLPKDVSLGPDEYLRWTAEDQGIQASGTLLASSERFRLGLDADLPPPLAEHIEKEWQQRKAEAGQMKIGGDEGAILQRLVQAVELKRDGGHLTAAFDLHEPPIDQARELGAAASLGVFAVRRYLATAKEAEARNSIGQIAKDYVSWYEKDDGKGSAKKKLVSFPPVPKTVPSGAKYQSSRADWKPWEPLLFSMDAPQYYQYEVRAAKDGNSADIFARGDLDGDGKQSQFKLHIAVDRKTNEMTVDPTIEEQDPDE
jgi:type IV pilus assembly protein PilA